MNDCTRRCSVRYKNLKAENASLVKQIEAESDRHKFTVTKWMRERKELTDALVAARAERDAWMKPNIKRENKITELEAEFAGAVNLHIRAEKAEAALKAKDSIIQNWREQGLSLWDQFAHYRTPEGVDKYSNMALSALEDLENALESLGLIDNNGVPQWDAISPSPDKPAPTSYGEFLALSDDEKMRLVGPKPAPKPCEEDDGKYCDRCGHSFHTSVCTKLEPGDHETPMTQCRCVGVAC